MKKSLQISLKRVLLLVAGIFLLTTIAQAQESKKDRRMVEDCEDAQKEFIRTDSLMKNLFASAYGYVIFPSVGKGAIGVGGASGGGAVFTGGKAIGRAQMTQVTVGFQLGGQAYREVIFFQDKETLNRFKENNFEFSAQASAVAAKAGASGNIKYANGVMVFTQQKGGLMYEASIGGQKFKFTAF